MSLKCPYDPLNLEAKLELLWLGTVDHFDIFHVELMKFWVTRGIVQYPKNFKRQFLTGKVLPDFRDKVSMEPVQEKGSYCPDFHVVQWKDWERRMGGSVS